MEVEVAIPITIPFKYQVYSPYVIVTGPQKGEVTPSEILIREEYFKQQSQEDWSWLREIPKHQRLICVTETYLKSYLAGFFVPHAEDFVSPKGVLENGRLDLIFENRLSPEGYLYQAGKPVNRPFNFQFWESSYDLETLTKVLKEIPQFTKVELKVVDRVNRELCGDRMIVAWYLPTAEELDGWVKAGGQWYLIGPSKVRESLNQWQRKP